MPAHRELADLYASIREPMERVEAALRRETEVPDPAVRELLSQSGLAEGKRMRPGLLLLSARVSGGIGEAHVALAAIVELIHHATLLHDDVLDGAERRRHQPTLNAARGNAVPVLLGDFIFARAFHLAARLDCGEANRVLSHATQEMCAGELSQTLLRRRLDLTEETYLSLVRRKTAALFGAAARLGALEQKDPLPRDVLEAFGTGLGIAFQIVDDCLDLSGDESVAGKSLGTDLTLGKMTLPLIALRARMPEDRRFQLDALLLSPDGMSDRRSLLRGWSEEFGADRYALDRAGTHLMSAKAALRPFAGRAGVPDLLSLADFVLDRRF